MQFKLIVLEFPPFKWGGNKFFGGLPKPAPALEIITNDIHYRELTLTGSHGSTPSQHSQAIDIILEKLIFFKN